MTGLFNDSMKLFEMDGILEQYVTDGENAVRIITDIPLTIEDYKLLVEQLDQASADMEMLSRYRLSMVVAWAFALRHETAGMEYVHMLEKLKKLPQYSIRAYYEVCNSVFLDYNLISYFNEIKNAKDLYSVMLVHAGIPETMSEQFLRLVDELRKSKDIERALRLMSTYMGGQLAFLSTFVERKLLKELLMTATEIMDDCCEESMSMEGLLDKYPNSSSRLIREILEWSKQKSMVCA